MTTSLFLTFLSFSQERRKWRRASHSASEKQVLFCGGDGFGGIQGGIWSGISATMQMLLSLSVVSQWLMWRGLFGSGGRTGWGDQVTERQFAFF